MGQAWTKDLETKEAAKWVIKSLSDLLFKHTQKRIEDVVRVLFVDGSVKLHAVFVGRQSMYLARCYRHMTANRVRELSPAMCALTGPYLYKLHTRVFADEDDWNAMYAAMINAIRLHPNTKASTVDATIAYLEKHAWHTRHHWSHFHLCQCQSLPTLGRSASSLEEGMHGAAKTHIVSHVATVYMIDGWLRALNRVLGRISEHVHKHAVSRPTVESADRFHLRQHLRQFTSMCFEFIAGQWEFGATETWVCSHTSGSATRTVFAVRCTSDATRHPSVVIVRHDAAGVITPCGCVGGSTCSCGDAASMAMPCVHILLVCAKFGVTLTPFISRRYRVTVAADILARVRAHDDGLAAPVAAVDPPLFVPRPVVAVVPSARQSAADERVLQSLEDDAGALVAWVAEQRRRRAQRQPGVVSGAARATVSQTSSRSKALQRRVSTPSLLAGEDAVSPGRCVRRRQRSVADMLSARAARLALASSDDDDDDDDW
jgi:hypothetical protein